MMWKPTRKILSEMHWDKAIERAEGLPIYEGSHRGAKANEVGCLGEIVMEIFFKEHDIAYKDDRVSTQHDYVIKEKYTLDVKTKDRTVPPRSYYDCSVPLYNHEHQRPDYYYFVSLFRDKKYVNANDIRRFKEAFICGGKDLQSLEKEGKQWEAGETDPSNNTTFWTACINIRMDKLIPNKDMIKIFKNDNI